MKDIKVLLFDLGGVIIDIDPSITINALKSMSKKSSEDFNALDYKHYKEESKRSWRIYLNIQKEPFSIH